MPLMSKFAREYKRSERMSSECPGPSCLDMMGSIRPKIYLLVKKIVERANTEAQLFEGLSVKNQVRKAK
jgi:hypothetical protein